MERRRYRNLSGNSGVMYYVLGPTFIRVWFEKDGSYEYNDSRPGRDHVEAMKRLAEEGRGLATYINRHVRENYSRKL